MLKLFFNLNSFQVMSSRNLLKYFSTTPEVKKNVKTNILKTKKKLKDTVVKNKISKNNFSKNKKVNNDKAISNNKTIINNKKVSNKLKLFVMLLVNNPSLVKVRSFNKLRSLKNNYFRNYYYNRFPMRFRLYPFAFNYYLRLQFITLFSTKSKKVWRRKLHRTNRKLLRLNNIFLGLNTTLLNLRFSIDNLISKKAESIPLSKKSKKNKKGKNKLTALRWRQLLKFKSDKNKMVYRKYEKNVAKFTQNYVNNTYIHNKLRKVIGFPNRLHYNQRRVGYMNHIKFYKTQQKYYNFRMFRYYRLYMKRLKWIYKKRLNKSLKKNFFRSYRTSLYVKKRKPYRLQRRTRVYKYKRFSYYWLRYFFKRFKQIYIDSNKSQTNYNDIKKYLLCWLGKLQTYKVISVHSLNPARGFLLYKSNKLYNEVKQNGLFTGYAKLTFLHDRNELDDIFKSIVNKKRYLYRNFYWRFYKSALERRKAQILKRHYHFTWGLRPYIFVHKKQKVFYNWADRHIFKRFPLYRYKYTLFFKFPRFADYRRLFKNQLREQHVFRYLYRLKLSQLIKAFRKATYKTKRIFELMFLKYFELRLDTVVYRLNFAWSLKHARQLILRGLFVVNNKIVDNNKYHVGLGDVIMPVKRLRMQPLSKKYLNYVDYGVGLSWTRLFYRQIQSDQYPAHFLLNERIPAGMIVNKFNPNTLRFNKPYSVQFLTLSLLKYN